MPPKAHSQLLAGHGSEVRKKPPKEDHTLRIPFTKAGDFWVPGIFETVSIWDRGIRQGVGDFESQHAAGAFKGFAKSKNLWCLCLCFGVMCFVALRALV